MNASIPPKTDLQTLSPIVGEAAPDVALARVPGEISTPLSDCWQNGPAVLVFLRHLGCIFCREHVAELRRARAEFARRSATLAIITVSKPEDSDSFVRDRDLADDFVCLCDPEKRAYSAYHLSRGGAAEIFAPVVFAQGFRAALHGHFIGMPKGDPFQMPGVFIVDTTGTVRYAHRNRTAGDNPPNTELLAALDRI